MRVRTLPELFQHAVHEHGPRTALRYHRDDEWHPITYGQLGRLVEEAALGLIAAGVEAGDTVALEAQPGPQAAIAELASLHAGARVLAVPPGEDTLAGAEPTAAFVSPDGAGREAWAEDGSVETLVVFEATPGVSEEQALAEEAGAWTMTQLYREGQQAARKGRSVDERIGALDSEEPAHLVPASEGSTRALTHERLLQQARQVASRLELAPGHACLSLAGLADPLHRTAGHHAVFLRGGHAWLSRSPDRVLEDLQAARPELLVAPASAYAAIRADLEDRLDASQPSQRRLFDWARSVGESRRQARTDGRTPGVGLRVRHWLADRLVLAKARAALGLENLQAALVTDAVDRDRAAWLQALGLPIVDALAPDELGLVVSLAQPRKPRTGSLGRPLAGVETRIEEGRVHVRAPSREGQVWLDTGLRARRGEQGRLHRPATGEREREAVGTEP